MQASPAAGSSSDSLFGSLYDELRRLARREAARHNAGASSSPTTLLHEAYMDMATRDGLAFRDKGQFLAYAAKAMRTLAIDRARSRDALKRGGAFHITSLDTQTAEDVAEPMALVDVGAALDELAVLEPALACVVELKFFCGFSIAEIAAMHDVSERTVQRQWEKARILLYRALNPGP